MAGIVAVGVVRMHCFDMQMPIASRQIDIKIYAFSWIRVDQPAAAASTNMIRDRLVSIHAQNRLQIDDRERL